MSTSCRSYSAGCTVIAVAVSFILGVIAAFLRITAAITLTPAFLWVLFGVSVVYLTVALIAAVLSRGGCCESLCSIVTALLSGIFGTVLLSVVLLGIEFAATSLLGAALTGALLFFFFLTVTSAACLVRCFLNCDD